MSPKILFALFVSLFLSLFLFGTALANDYEIPVIAGGKVFTISISVSDSAIISATTKDSGVSVGKPVAKAKAVGEPGEWAKLMPDALERVSVEKDKFSGNIFYFSKSIDSLTGQSQVYAYVGTDGKNPWFRLLVAMVTDRVLMFDGATVLADGQKFALTFKPLEGTHDYIGDNSFFDAADIQLSGKDDMAMLQAVAKAESVEIRFYARSDRYDYELSKTEKQAFAEALAVYELLGGTFTDKKPNRLGR